MATIPAYSGTIGSTPGVGRISWQTCVLIIYQNERPPLQSVIADVQLARSVSTGYPISIMGRRSPVPSYQSIETGIDFTAIFSDLSLIPANILGSYVDFEVRKYDNAKYYGKILCSGWGTVDEISVDIYDPAKPSMLNGIIRVDELDNDPFEDFVE